MKNNYERIEKYVRNIIYLICGLILKKRRKIQKKWVFDKLKKKYIAQLK